MIDTNIIAEGEKDTNLSEEDEQKLQEFLNTLTLIKCPCGNKMEVI